MELKLPKRKKVFKKHGSNIRPEPYWQIMVYIVCILSLGSFFFGYKLFKDVSKEVNLDGNNTGKQEIVKKARLEKILEGFEAKEKRSSEILSSPSPVIDPSI